MRKPLTMAAMLVALIVSTYAQAGAVGKYQSCSGILIKK